MHARLRLSVDPSRRALDLDSGGGVTSQAMRVHLVARGDRHLGG